MYARIGTWQGTSEELSQWIARSREHVKPDIVKERCARRQAVTTGRTGATVVTDRYEVIDRASL